MLLRNLCIALGFAAVACAQVAPAPPVAGTQPVRVRVVMSESLRRQKESVAKQMRSLSTRIAVRPVSPMIASAAPPTFATRLAPPCPPLSEEWLRPEIERTASEYDLPEGLLRAVAATESANRPCAVSSKGALGLMQIMPATAASLGLSNPLDPHQNLDAGARYLKLLLSRYGGDVRSALSAYNAGPGAVDRFGGTPPFEETQEYVKKILSEFTPVVQ